MAGWRIFAVLSLALTAINSMASASTMPAVPDMDPEQGQTEPGFHKNRHFTVFAAIEKVCCSGISINDNYYTSLVIRRIDEPLDSNARYLPYKKRKLIWRMGIAKKYSFTVILKAEAAKYAATIPLLSREYESSRRKGENFSRSIEFDNLGQPLFMVGSDPKTSVASLRLGVNVTSDTSSDVMIKSLSLLTKALKTISPSSAVLTTLSEGGSKDMAEALDDAIGSIYSTSLKESMDFDIDLKSGNEYTIEIFGPISELHETSSSAALGKWVIGFARGRPSIFSTEEDENKAIADARRKYPSILSFELLNNLGAYGSIAGFLKQQDWWAAAVAKLSSANTTVASGDRSDFCRKIRGAIGMLGLNDRDGRLVSEAVTHSDLVPGMPTGGFTEESCTGPVATADSLAGKTQSPR